MPKLSEREKELLALWVFVVGVLAALLAALISSLCFVMCSGESGAPGLLEALAGEGVTTLAGIAAALNAREMRTPRGGQWHKTSVANLLARLAH